MKNTKNILQNDFAFLYSIRQIAGLNKNRLNTTRSSPLMQTTNMQTPKKRQFLNSFHLKILAMVLMLCSHMWSTIIAGNNWLDAIGRLAFPVFAFLIVEGFFHTHSFKKYLLRLFIFALISELPFNLMAEGGWIYPFHQNVLFTFCIALLFMRWMENVRETSKWRFALRVLVSIIFGFLIGFITMVDYFGYGILMVFVFYLFRNVPFGWIGQLICMIYINWEMMGGLVYLVPIFGRTLEIPQQGLAVLALIPIWLYNGKQGPYNKTIQYIFYSFYPIHMTILAILMRL